VTTYTPPTPAPVANPCNVCEGPTPQATTYAPGQEQEPQAQAPGQEQEPQQTAELPGQEQEQQQAQAPGEEQGTAEQGQDLQKRPVSYASTSLQKR
jgi:hypothetical protein